MEVGQSSLAVKVSLLAVSQLLSGSTWPVAAVFVLQSLESGFALAYRPTHRSLSFHRGGQRPGKQVQDEASSKERLAEFQRRCRRDCMKARACWSLYAYSVKGDNAADVTIRQLVPVIYTGKEAFTEGSAL